MSGLRTIVEGAGTLHTIELSPVRADFCTEGAYQAAHRAWLRRQHWTFETRDTPTGTPEPPDTQHAPGTSKEHSP